MEAPKNSQRVKVRTHYDYSAAESTPVYRVGIYSHEYRGNLYESPCWVFQDPKDGRWFSSIVGADWDPV